MIRDVAVINGADNCPAPPNDHFLETVLACCAPLFLVKSLPAA
jgi:hypothetical protein